MKDATDLAINMRSMSVHVVTISLYLLATAIVINSDSWRHHTKNYTFPMLKLIDLALYIIS